ncbi:cytochrome b5-like heme/steroid binding domain-containing protein, partial [Ascoidea rubescens DSM 1968]
KTYTLEEIANHTSPNDLWMIIYGKVYSITPSFISSHPGGPEVLLDCGGIDASSFFEDVGHSEYSREMLSPFYIGEL